MAEEYNSRIGEMLISAAEAIEKDSYTSAVDQIQRFVSDCPQCIDARMVAEIKLINQMIEYKSMLKEWAYFRAMKLVYRYCEIQYASLLDNGKEEVQEELVEKDTIWWCWLQGYEAAPRLIKACYKSIGKLGKKIRIITAENFQEYVRLPDYILKKWKNGIISNTHFSDILRLELLVKLGGTWIDSTVLCTEAERITDVMKKSSLFCYSYVMRDSINQEIMFDNWFLHCTSPSRILNDTRRMLLEFWKKEDNAKHYFIFHLLFSIACRRNPEEWKNIPVFSPEPCHVLQHEMLEPFSEQRYQQIMGMSGIHKLTYKYDKEIDISGTYLEYILNIYEVDNR